MTPYINKYDEVIVHEWPGWYLRDDVATGCRDRKDGEAYSLFRSNGDREGVYAGSLRWAILECEAVIPPVREV